MVAAGAFAAACSDSPTSVAKRSGLGAPPLRASGVGGVAGADFTGTNAAVDGPGTCMNGPGLVNCNLYGDKDFVWLNGGPTNGTSQLTDGVYFFAVLQPGGANNDINDYQSGSSIDVGNKLTNLNLSDNVDLYTARRFRVYGHKIVEFLGSGHDTYNTGTVSEPNLLLRLADYATTLNPGGEYQAAICQIDDMTSYDGTTHTYNASIDPVDPNSCKYDNFKVREAATVPQVTVVKTVNPSFDRTYSWLLDKMPGTMPTSVQPGVTYSLPYIIRVSLASPAFADGNWAIGGSITVTNNGTIAADVKTLVDVSDFGTATVTCSGANAIPQTLAVGASIVCSYTEAVTPKPTYNVNFLNTATATVDDPASLTDLEFVGTATGQFTTPTNIVNGTIEVHDIFSGTNTLVGTVSYNDPALASPGYVDLSLTISYTAPTVLGNCGSSIQVNNLAQITTVGLSATVLGSDAVQVLFPVNCGCTLGYWKNNDLYNWVKIANPSTYGFVALKGSPNSGSGDWYWKGTVAAPNYGWLNGAPSTYRTLSSKLNDAQAFGTTALSDPAYSTLAGLTFNAALNLGGGDTFLGKAQNLMRQAVAAMLNASWTDGTHTMGYPMTVAQIRTAVNTALASKDAAAITALQTQLAGYNQSGTTDLTNNHACPLNSAGVFQTQ